MLFRFLLLPVLMAAATVAALGQASDPARIDFFEKQIRPLLVEHCVVCHGPRLQQGGLRLDSAEFPSSGGPIGTGGGAGEGGGEPPHPARARFRRSANAAYRASVGK